ncbi:MAG: 4a-hydroxytetrahydrobiopterin dehydratase [Bryobacteraceae bacterium]|nr:4a-hydroxytetrahydrobiopterin dehydratase [Bryobacteraceae bacterium]
MKLTTIEIRKLLKQHPGWSVENGKLHRDYRFADFSQAIGFLTMAALKIEVLDHHPEWANVYNRVSVNCVTHDAGGITMKDFALAAVLDQVAKRCA